MGGQNMDAAEPEKAVFPCSRCQMAVEWPAKANQMYATCPACGLVNRVPYAEGRGRLRATLLFLLMVCVLVAVCWTVTATIGGEMIRPEVGPVLAKLKMGTDATIQIRAPAPLVVSFRVTGTQVKAGGVRVGVTVTKYYFWYLRAYRELDETRVPAALKWIWR
jgi:hypothetical protein